MTIKNSFPTMVEGNLRLRAPHPDDVAARLDAGNSSEIQAMYGLPSGATAPLTQAQAQEWVTFHVDHPHSWFIDIDEVLAGVIFLHSLNETDRRATLAMGLLRDAHLGQGYGTRALKLLIPHAFGEMGLHRLGLRVIDYNARAISAYKKAGFVVEGRERQSAKVGDTWHDDIMMGLLASDMSQNQNPAGEAL